MISKKEWTVKKVLTVLIFIGVAVSLFTLSMFAGVYVAGNYLATHETATYKGFR